MAAAASMPPSPARLKIVAETNKGHAARPWRLASGVGPPDRTW
jgi:hypothetical protein